VQHLLEVVVEEADFCESTENGIHSALDSLQVMLNLNHAPPLIYVAGQYFPSTKEYGEKSGIMHWEMHKNIEKARAIGAECAMKGWMPIIPHTNTAWMSGIQAHEWWYESTNEQLRVCDAIVMVDGWEESHGAQMEHDEAVRMGIFVYYSTDEVLDLGEMSKR